MEQRVDYQKSVLNSYQEKNYVKTLTLIDDCPVSKVRESSYYRVLRAVCLVNLGIDIESAHRILDEVLLEVIWLKHCLNSFFYLNLSTLRKMKTNSRFLPKD
jgi:hypothetical protein